MSDFCKTFWSTTWIKPSVTTPKLDKFHSINYRRSISCSIFLFLGEHSPLTPLIFRSLAQRVRWAQGQCVRKKRFEISRWLMRDAPSLHARLAGIGWNLYRWTKHRTRRMDKRQFSGSRFRTFVAFFYRDERLFSFYFAFLLWTLG